VELVAEKLFRLRLHHAASGKRQACPDPALSSYSSVSSSSGDDASENSQQLKIVNKNDDDKRRIRIRSSEQPLLCSSSNSSKKRTRTRCSGTESKQEGRSKASGSRKKKPTPDNPGFTAKHHRRQFAQHNYHDHSQDQAEETEDPAAMAATHGGVTSTFPMILHTMLENVSRHGLEHIVSWQPHGRAFCVHDPAAFVKVVMPLYFRQSKMSSFQRQLNLYGFARLTHAGPDKGAYYQEFFLRGRPDLCVRIHRTRVKGTGVRTSSNPEAEPDFYKMSPVGGPRQAPRSQPNREKASGNTTCPVTGAQDSVASRTVAPESKLNPTNGSQELESDQARTMTAADNQATEVGREESPSRQTMALVPVPHYQESNMTELHLPPPAAAAAAVEPNLEPLPFRPNEASAFFQFAPVQPATVPGPSRVLTSRPIPSFITVPYGGDFVQQPPPTSPLWQQLPSSMVSYGQQRQLPSATTATTPGVDDATANGVVDTDLAMMQEMECFLHDVDLDSSSDGSWSQIYTI